MRRTFASLPFVSMALFLGVSFGANDAKAPLTVLPLNTEFLPSDGHSLLSPMARTAMTKAGYKINLQTNEVLDAGHRAVGIIPPSVPPRGVATNSKQEKRTCGIHFDSKLAAALMSQTEPALQEDAGQQMGQGGQVPDPVADLGQQTNRLEESVSGAAIVNAALERQREVWNSVASDTAMVSKPYETLPLGGWEQNLNRASEMLNSGTQYLSNAKGGMEQGDLERFNRVFQNAEDKVKGALDALHEGVKNNYVLGENSPFAGLFPQAKGADRLTDSVASMFGVTKGKDQSAVGVPSMDGLVNRLALLAGLPPDQHQQALAGMKLLELPKLPQRDGRVVVVPIPHNGYLWGAGATGVDCSSLISQSLPPELRKNRFTTLDFRNMWLYRKKGTFPRPPQYTPERELLVKDVAMSFIPLDVYSGERLMIGDLLIYRIEAKTAGHVFLIRDYDPNRMTAHVIEAAQSAGTIREREFGLTLIFPKTRKTYMRPGLMGLRLKTSRQGGCKLPDRTKPRAV